MLPIAPNGKRPLNAGGCRAASTDSAAIDEWWRRWPTANVAVATGTCSDLAVLDVDGEPGRQSLAELEAAHGVLPGTLTVVTARGCHMYFRHPPGLGIGAGRYGAGLDHRGDGGYVIAPPSVHPSGHTYLWLDTSDANPTPWDHRLPPWPNRQLPVELSPVQRTARLLQLPPQPGTGPLPGLARVVAEAPTGTRNNRLNWAAYRARKHAAAGKLDLKQARAALLDAALKVGLPEREALATIASGMRSAGAA